MDDPIDHLQFNSEDRMFEHIHNAHSSMLKAYALLDSMHINGAEDFSALLQAYEDIIHKLADLDSITHGGPWPKDVDFVPVKKRKGDTSPTKVGYSKIDNVTQIYAERLQGEDAKD